jgi:hypothetical protein
MGTTAKTDRSATADLERERPMSQSQNQAQAPESQPTQQRSGREQGAAYIEHPARSGPMERSTDAEKRQSEQPAGSRS